MRSAPTALFLALGIAALALRQGPARAEKPAPEFRGVLSAPAEATRAKFAAWKKQGVSVVALLLSEETRGQAAAAAEAVRKEKLGLRYWLEIGRCPTLASAHPEWMASLQGHEGWRNHFPDFPAPAKGVVVKNFPWVPVAYRESFDAHLKRVEALVRDLPRADGLFLCDLQGAPSACGCGNDLCRWTVDYGPLKTATETGPDAAARFVAAVRKLQPEGEVIPVWVNECEFHDTAAGGRCHGVGCFTGACWYAWAEQLTPLAQAAPVIAALVPYRAFRRDDPRYGPQAGWVKAAIEDFASMPPRRKGEAVPADRLIAVLQGWDVTETQVAAQIARAREAGAKGYLLAAQELDQSWEPRAFKLDEDKQAPPETAIAPPHACARR